MNPAGRKPLSQLSKRHLRRISQIEAEILRTAYAEVEFSDFSETNNTLCSSVEHVENNTLEIDMYCDA